MRFRLERARSSCPPKGGKLGYAGSPVELSHQLNGELVVWHGAERLHRMELPLDDTPGQAPRRQAEAAEDLHLCRTAGAGGASVKAQRRASQRGDAQGGRPPLLWGEPAARWTTAPLAGAQRAHRRGGNPPRPGFPPEGETGKGESKFLAAAGHSLRNNAVGRGDRITLQLGCHFLVATTERWPGTATHSIRHFSRSR